MTISTRLRSGCKIPTLLHHVKALFIPNYQSNNQKYRDESENLSNLVHEIPDFAEWG